MKHLFLTIISLFFLNSAISQSASSLFQYDQDTDRHAVVVQSQNIDSVTTFKKIVLNGYDSKVPFYHYENKRKANAPNIFLLHGLGDDKDDWVYPSEPYLEWSRNTTAIKDSLIFLGYNVVIPDAKFHGERSYELGFRSPATLPPVISRNEQDTRLFEELITSTVKDFRIIMDYIDGQTSEVESTFGVIGYSMGSNLAMLLSAADSRISCVVACVPPLNLPARGMEAFDWNKQVIQGQLDITPMMHVASQKSPIILLMGKNDYFTTAEEVSTYFEKVATDEKELKYFNSGHILPNEYRYDAIGWITRYAP